MTNINTIRNIKSAAYAFGVTGFVSALLSSALAFGLAAGWHVAYRDNPFFRPWDNAFQDLAGRFIVIATCLLLLIIFLKVSDKLFIRIVALIPLGLAIHQSYIVVLSGQDGLPDWITEYSRSLEVIPYLGVFFITLEVSLVIMHLSLIWSTYRTASLVPRERY